MISPKVSVIVPNYNHSAYLCQRIDSILQQSYTDYELILLDDCSTDASREVLAAYQHMPQVTQVIFNEKNSGSTFKQWERGIQLAKGEYIWIAESDDMADTDFLKETVEQLDRNKAATIVFTGSQMIDENGKQLPKDWDHFSPGMNKVATYDGDEYLKRKMLWGNSVYNASMVLFRKACYYKVPADYCNYRYCGDWLFWIGVCRQGQVISINRKLNYFRQHLNKVSPKAVKEGLYFKEGNDIMVRMVDYLNLGSYQRMVVSGRIWKRVLRFKKENEELGSEYINTLKKGLLRKRHLSIAIYTIDKWFNFSDLQR